MKIKRTPRMLWSVAILVSLLTYFYLISQGVYSEQVFEMSPNQDPNKTEILPDIQLVKRVFEELSKVMTVSV